MNSPSPTHNHTLYIADNILVNPMSFQFRKDMEILSYPDLKP